ncbi:MAG TPA: hypothetical protein VFK70_17245 [Vicinamibacteria bacterium]|nr:hypothetical protein [Vicinamibacteria bacterium]
MIARRAALKALVAAPLIPLAARAEARDYASAEEVLGEIDRLESELDARLATLAASFPAAAALAASIRADHDRHRRARRDLRRRLRLSEAAPSSAPTGRVSVDALRALAQDLVYAYAEGLPAVKDAQGVDLLARHMVDDARHLTVLQMWTETEQPGA